MGHGARAGEAQVMTAARPGNDAHVCGAAISMFGGDFKIYGFCRWGRDHPLPARLMLVQPTRDRLQLIWSQIPMTGGVSILVDGYISPAFSRRFLHVCFWEQFICRTEWRASGDQTQPVDSGRSRMPPAPHLQAGASDSFVNPGCHSRDPVATMPAVPGRLSIGARKSGV